MKLEQIKARLSEDELRVLALMARGRTTAEIASALGVDRSYVTSHLYKNIRTALRVKENYAATALYGHAVGMRGEQIADEPADDRYPHFEYGTVSYHASLITDSVRQPDDFSCPVVETPFPLPVEVQDDIKVRSNAILVEAEAAGRTVYDANIFVVRRVRSDTEMRTRMRLTLQSCSWLVHRAIREHLGDTVGFDPANVTHPTLSLPLAVTLHVIAGDPPHLIISKRSSSMGLYPGFYGACAAGISEADQDYVPLPTGAVFSPVKAMYRECREERLELMGLKDFEDSLQMCGLVFDYKTLDYNITGYVWAPDMPTSRIVQALSTAHEVTSRGRGYLALPFPRSRHDPTFRRDLQGIADHLRHNNWVPPHAIGLICLLKREFGQEAVHRAMSGG